MIPTARWTPEEGVSQMVALLGQEHVRLREGCVRVAPGDVEQIGAVLCFARENELTVTTTGGGTKRGWGNPVHAAIELSLERMDRLREHAWQDMTCTVEAGIHWQTMQAELARHGQMVALDALWPEQATVGGVIAANDSGALRYKFGGLRDLVIGMRVVLADGTVARTGGKVVKNVAGYDLHKLMTGSLGTLAVITEVNFRLHPVEAQARSWTISLPDAQADAAAFTAPLRALRDSHLTPTSVQVRASRQGCAVDVRIAGAAEHLDAYGGRLREIFSRCEAAAANEEIWGARQQLFEEKDCVVVKISALPDDVCALCAELQQTAVRVVAQAHGLVTAALPQAAAQVLIERLRGRVAPSGGSVVVQHLPEALRGSIDVWGPAPGTLPLMQEIKRRFDPSRVLSPGRLWGNL